MDYVILVFIVIGLGIVGVQGQESEIVKDILPEVQRVGRTARLNCTVARLGTNSVQWAKKGKSDFIISINTEVTTLNPTKGGIPRYRVRSYTEKDQITFQLIISRLRPGWFGTYECTIIVANKKDKEWKRKQGKLVVQFPPVIKPGSTTAIKMIEEGANTTIECDAFSVPAPNITWVRSDGRLLPNGKALSRGKILPINYADIKFAGMYRCVADNNIKPPAEALTQVYVFQAPSIRVLQDSVGQFDNGRTIARLDCIVQGYPIPTVYWEFHGANPPRRLTNNDKFDTSKQATDNQNLFSGEQWYTLEIRNVQPGDIGKYVCVGKNGKGIGTAAVNLFATPDCQGAQCYSQMAENFKSGTTLSLLSPLALLLCIVSTLVLPVLRLRLVPSSS